MKQSTYLSNHLKPFVPNKQLQKGKESKIPDHVNDPLCGRFQVVSKALTGYKALRGGKIAILSIPKGSVVFISERTSNKIRNRNADGLSKPVSAVAEKTAKKLNLWANVASRDQAKLRASTADVVGIATKQCIGKSGALLEFALLDNNTTIGRSLHNQYFKYEEGMRIVPKLPRGEKLLNNLPSRFWFNDEGSSGIHFFLDLRSALEYC